MVTFLVHITPSCGKSGSTIRAEAENTKVVIRNIRRDANEMLKKLQKDGLPEDMAKDGEGQIQKIIDGAIAKVDEKVAAKEADVMKI